MLEPIEGSESPGALPGAQAIPSRSVTRDTGVSRWPHVRVQPITHPPRWAGEYGEWLVSATRRQASYGFTPHREEEIDPLLPLNELLSSGSGRTNQTLQLSFADDTTLRIRLGRPSWGKRRRAIPESAFQDEPTIVTAPNGHRVVVERLADFDLCRVLRSYPMRDFPRRLTQQNKPVVAYMHTMKQLVSAESHHERVFLVLADWHPLVAFVASQPFTIVWPKKSTPSSHTPDFILASFDGIPVVVDVKTPEDRASDYWQQREPTIRAALAAVGVEYLVWTGIPRGYRINLEDFTSARVTASSVRKWSRVAVEIAGAGMPARELATRLAGAGYPYLNALTLIRHLLWLHALETDMHRVFTLDSNVIGAKS